MGVALGMGWGAWLGDPLVASAGWDGAAGGGRGFRAGLVFVLKSI